MDTNFFMPLTGAENLLGRGVILFGTISSGTVNKGDKLLLSTGVTCCVKEIFLQNKLRPSARKGETVLLLVKGEGIKLTAQGIPQGAFLSGEPIEILVGQPVEDEDDDGEIIYEID